MADLESLGIKYIHADASDCLAGVSEHRLPEIKAGLIARYGDFDVRAVASQYGGAELEYQCPQFDKDLHAHNEAKAAWCAKYGCD